MTILASSHAIDKKPLVEAATGADTLPVATAPSDVESCVGGGGGAGAVRCVKRPYHPKSFLFTLILASCILIIGFMIAYSFYHTKMMKERLVRFHGFCSIPYEGRQLQSNYPDLNPLYRQDPEFLQNYKPWLNYRMQKSDSGELFASEFLEEFELGMNDEEDFAKISIPKFEDDRDGRFLHDFKYNQTAIIDQSSGRCFLMPLDREHILVPTSLYDLVNKMLNGDYNINLNTLRQKWTVVLPQIADRTGLSPRIVEECSESQMYQLTKYENYVGGVVKRSADISKSGKFAEFAGRDIIEIDIINIDALEHV